MANMTFAFDSEYIYKGRTYRYRGQSGFKSFQAIDNGDIIILTDEQCKEMKESGQAIAKVNANGEIWTSPHANVIQSPVAVPPVPDVKMPTTPLPVDEKPEVAIPVRTTKKDEPLIGVAQPKK